MNNTLKTNKTTKVQKNNSINKKGRICHMVKTNIFYHKAPWIAVGILLGLGVVQYILQAAISRPEDNNNTISTADYMLIFGILIACLASTNIFYKFVNLGAKRKDIVKGIGLTYIVVSAVLAIQMLLTVNVIDKILTKAIFYSRANSIMSIDTTIFAKHGVIVSGLQYFAFVLMSLTIIHTICVMQDRWWGWVIAGLLICYEAIFTPAIESIRAINKEFWVLTFTQNNPFLQICCALAVSVIAYAISVPILLKKKI